MNKSSLEPQVVRIDDPRDTSRFFRVTGATAARQAIDAVPGKVGKVDKATGRLVKSISATQSAVWADRWTVEVQYDAPYGLS